MFTKNDVRSFRQMLDGVRLKTLAWGEHTLLTEVRLDRGAVVPTHDHAQEQTGYLISGRLEFLIDDERTVAEPGDSWSLPGNQAHGARALDTCANARRTSGYACAWRKHQSIKILAHLIRQNRSSWAKHAIPLVLVLAAAVIGHTAEIDATSADGEPGALPVDYPRQRTLDAEAGQLALGIDPYRLKDAFNGKLSMLSYTNFEIVEVGEYQSTVRRVSETVLPNALIIPLRTNEEVAPGDLVVTWWQTGGGLQHALVTGGTPTQPVVRYVTLSETLKDAKNEHVLKPRSFNKLGAPFELGSNVFYPNGPGHSWGTLLNLADGRLLVLEGGRSMKVVPQDGARTFPAVPALEPGQRVLVAKMSKVGPATVVGVDSTNGKVRVKLEFSTKKEETVPFGRVAPMQ